MAQRDTKVSELCLELGVTKVTIYRYVAPDGSLRDRGRQVLARQAVSRAALNVRFCSVTVGTPNTAHRPYSFSCSGMDLCFSTLMFPPYLGTLGDDPAGTYAFLDSQETFVLRSEQRQVVGSTTFRRG